jgi:hypothetical protein
MLSSNERGKHLNGWPLHVTKWWQRWDSTVGERPSLVWVFSELGNFSFHVWAWTFRPRMTVIDVRKGGCRWGNAIFWTMFHPGTTRLSLCTDDTIAVANIQRAHVELQCEASLREGICSGQNKGTFYCLARELVFWWGDITQVKQQWGWSAHGWMTATRYKAG